MVTETDATTPIQTIENHNRNNTLERSVGIYLKNWNYFYGPNLRVWKQLESNEQELEQAEGKSRSQNQNGK